MFNNREIATAIWLTLFFAICILAIPGFRRSIPGVFRAFLTWKILGCVAAMLLYTAATVAALYAIGFWRSAMLKDTVLWFCFVAIVMVVRFVTSHDNENILRAVVADNIKLVIFLEFLVGTYVMPLPAEIILVPVVTFIAMLDFVAKLDEKNADVAKFTSFLLAVIGLAIIGFAITRAIIDFRNLGTLDTVRTIAFPPLMSIAFIPFIYVLVIIANCEYLFIRLAVGRDKAPDVVRYAKRRIIVHCGLSLSRLRVFAKRRSSELTQIEARADVDRLFTAPTDARRAQPS